MLEIQAIQLYYQPLNPLQGSYCSMFKWLFYTLCSLLLIGCDTPSDDKPSISDLVNAAEKGDANAQAELGIIYSKGEGVEPSYQKSYDWSAKAALQGDPCGQTTLGYLYEMGHGVHQNYQTAAKWYKKSADQGNACAQVNLGNLYEQGQGVDQDFKQAANLYLQSAEQGNMNAQYKLGVLYIEERGVPRDLVKAYMWLNTALLNGNAYAEDLLFLIARDMTSEEIDKAILLSKEFTGESHEDCD